MTLSDTNNFQSMLKQKNLKNTKHRNSILEVIAQNGEPINAEAIYLSLKEQNISISLSTVYRVIEVLFDSGLLTKTSVKDDNKALFEINSMKHKHHLLCLKCRKLLAVEGCPLESYEKTIEEKFGFIVEGHNLELYGICKECKE